MSEAPHGGHDSRPGENPQASAGQQAPEPAAVQNAGVVGGVALGDERANEAPLGAPNSHSQSPVGAGAGLSAGAEAGLSAGAGAGPPSGSGLPAGAGAGPPSGSGLPAGAGAGLPAGGAGESQPGEESARAEDGQQGPGGDSYAWYRRGLDLLSRGSPAAAAELLERAAEAEPGARSIREALARAQFDAGRYAQAADNFRRNVEAIPSDDYAHFGLGLALARAGDPAAAAEHLALAAAMRPELAHYTEALRGVRATLAARTKAGAGAPPPPAPDGE